MTFIIVVLYFICVHFQSNQCQFLQCHDDPSYQPEEGPLEYIQYTWLGTLQYIHIKHGTPHYFRVPRVVLISRQFVLATAKDAAEVPDGYALGNIAFGEYERDERECGQTLKTIVAGVECPSAAILMPVSDVLLHPRPNTVAILKLLVQIQSQYMVPVCLPLGDYLATRNGNETRDTLYLVDFESDVPRDFIEEGKEITKLSLLPSELCYLNDSEKNVSVDVDNIVCTTGCGFHIGAATVIHEHTGHWALVALSLDAPPCPDPLRSSRQHPPAHHLLIHPYVPWISASISGQIYRNTDKDDPFGFVPRASVLDDVFGHNWNGRWWMGGIACYHRGKAASHMFKFYSEVFQIKPLNKMSLTYYLEIYSAYGSAVTCVKVELPYQIAKPTVWGLESSEIKLRIPVLNIKSLYLFQVEAYAYNVMEESTASKSEESKENMPPAGTG